MKRMKRFLACSVAVAMVFSSGSSFTLAEEETEPVQEAESELEDTELLQEYESEQDEEEEIPQEVIDEIVTRDEEGGAQIDALPDGDPDDTWSIYVYICGSNLEGGSVDELSPLAQLIVQAEQAQAEDEDNEDGFSLYDFLTEIWDSGSDLPEVMYTVQSTFDDGDEDDDEVSDAESETEDEDAADDDENDEEDAEEDTGKMGMGSYTIAELIETPLPENVQIVMMTGGSTSWLLPEVNPNRSQIFVYDTEGFREVKNDHIKDMGSGDTMSDFLAYCNENYPADHCILSLMDHGSGSKGFSYDDIYEDEISLSEFREALESVYTADPDDPPFEIIDFDACLMASMETAEYLYGYARYMVGTEEIGLGGTHAYTNYVEAIAENTGIDPAKVGKAIVDGTVDHIAALDYSVSDTMDFYGATMSLTDVTKAHEVYQAYENLCATVLKDSVEDNSVLTTMSRAAAKNLRFGANDYAGFCQVDLGILAANLEDIYPEEAGAVLDALSEASLYRAATRFHKNATGLSVYFPLQITEEYGLDCLVNYLYDVCESEDIAALYYYIFTGCLNDEYTDYVESQGYGTPEVLDTSPLTQLPYNEITAGDGANFSLTLTEEQQALVQDLSLYLIKMDGDNSVNLGEDKRLSSDGNGTITTDFDGTWLSIDGRTLEADVIDNLGGMVRYSAEILNDDTDSYMIIGQDQEDGQFSPQGVYTASKEETLGALVANYPDELEFGSQIAPVYTEVDPTDNSLTKVIGDSGEFSEDSVIGFSTLEDGEYYLMFVAYDVRGDEYYSAPMYFVMEDGEITEAATSQDSLVVGRQ